MKSIALQIKITENHLNKLKETEKTSELKNKLVELKGQAITTELSKIILELFNEVGKEETEQKSSKTRAAAPKANTERKMRSSQTEMQKASDLFEKILDKQRNPRNDLIKLRKLLDIHILVLNDLITNLITDLQITIEELNLHFTKSIDSGVLIKIGEGINQKFKTARLSSETAKSNYENAIQKVRAIISTHSLEHVCYLELLKKIDDPLPKEYLEQFFLEMGKKKHPNPYRLINRRRLEHSAQTLPVGLRGKIQDFLVLLTPTNTERAIIAINQASFSQFPEEEEFSFESLIESGILQEDSIQIEISDKPLILEYAIKEKERKRREASELT
ncbi:hypothetical protein DID78_01035 [Candidatus Marinamargulisbacteria bacterium SCGC AG-343-D04]|nr:hypothetical protein DID78_01035 [Candidatus Marinamargulisbacteria bacterium SCGC AG-343-D04]